MPRFCIIRNDSEDDDDIENEPEPDHPLGFGPQNHCKWMSLSAVRCTGQSFHGFDMSSAIRDYPSEFRQSYPPLSSYICRDTVCTRVLLSYHQSPDDDGLQNDEAASLWRKCMNTHQSATLDAKGITLANSLVPHKSINEMIDLERQKLQNQHREENLGVQTLISNLELEASSILNERRETVERQKREEEKIKREQSRAKQPEPATRPEAALSAIGNSDTTGISEDQSRRCKADPTGKSTDHGRNQNEKNKSMATSQIPEHVLKGKKLISQLVKLRQSIEPFEKNKAMSKRRLAMKKTIRGKLNTLSESAEKVKEVCGQVNAAIATARQEDTQIKEAMKQGQQGFTPDMALGKRYIVDLFASNVVQRIQAEGFNGPRGDGFPLAAMVAMVSSESKDIVPVLTAHIYTVCRIAIPSLPDAVASASEDEFMESLGMLRDKNGDFESWDRFSSRTENIISIVANIQASMPPTHSMFGGHKGAAEWLRRFLESLPPPPTSPLPLLTAPVLHAFLSGAGCMLADKYETLFKRSLQTISEEILDRLDQGEIGKPSFIRLSKTIEKGYDGFKSAFPPKAIPQMYNSSISAGFGNTGGIQGNQMSGSPFGGSKPSPYASNSDGTIQSNPFGSASNFRGTSTVKDVASIPFDNNPSPPANPFGSSSSRFEMNQSTSFGFGSDGSAASGWVSTGNKAIGNDSLMATLGNAKNSNPFAAEQGGNAHEPFGMPSNSPISSRRSFGSRNQVNTNTTPFGSTNQVRNSVAPFGSSNQAQSSTTPFGSSSQGQTTTLASPFGSNNPATVGASPFGSNNRADIGASPFGSNSQTTASFGSNSIANRSASPFGSSIRATNNPLSFGSSNRATTNASPFVFNAGNGNKSKKNAPTCKFFQRGQCRFGDKCKFSHDTGDNSSGFSWNQGGNSSGSTNNRSTPFGGGFSSNQRNPFA